MRAGGGTGAQGRPLVSAGCLAGLPAGSVYEVPAGARVTPLAAEEARRRGIRLVVPAADPGAGEGVALVRGMLAAGACRVGPCPADPTRLGDLASAIDHTLLRADASLAEIDRLCAEALEHRFASVCVNGTWVRRASELLSAGGPSHAFLGPNPAFAGDMVTLRAPGGEPVDVFGPDGRRIVHLVNHGSEAVRFAAPTAPGIYLVRAGSTVKKLVVVR